MLPMPCAAQGKGVEGQAKGTQKGMKKGWGSHKDPNPPHERAINARKRPRMRAAGERATEAFGWWPQFERLTPARPRQCPVDPRNALGTSP